MKDLKTIARRPVNQQLYAARSLSLSRRCECGGRGYMIVPEVISERWRNNTWTTHHVVPCARCSEDLS